MADYSTEYISEVMAQSYDRMQNEMMAKATGTTDKGQQDNPNEILTPTESSAAQELTEQAGQVEEASGLINDAMDYGGQYDSYSKYSAMTQKGMSDKMKALGMLDDAREDVDIQMHVAEFVDPITGETVNANNQDYVTDEAYQNSLDNMVHSGSTNVQWESSYAKYNNLNDDPDRAGNANKYNEAIYSEFFVDPEAMQYANDNDMIDTDRVIQDMNDIYTKSSASTAEYLRESATAERDMRQKQALDSTDAYNAQQTASQDIANKNNADIAKSQTDIKNSINQDKQNLASQSSVDSNTKPKTVINDAVANDRPT